MRNRCKSYRSLQGRVGEMSLSRKAAVFVDVRIIFHDGSGAVCCIRSPTCLGIFSCENEERRAEGKLMCLDLIWRSGNASLPNTGRQREIYQNALVSAAWHAQSGNCGDRFGLGR